MDLDKLRKMNRDLSKMHTVLHDEIFTLPPLDAERDCLIELSADVYAAIGTSYDIIDRKARGSM